VTGDILAIAGAGTTLLCVVAIVVLVYKLLGAVASERASLAAEVLAERARDAMGYARDGALADAAKARAERDAALARLAAVEKQRNEAQGEIHVESKDAAAAVDRVDAELSALMPLDDSGGAVAAAGADHGDAGSHTVPPASAGAPAGPGRSA
jgi:hypothetical protein